MSSRRSSRLAFASSLAAALFLGSGTAPVVGASPGGVCDDEVEAASMLQLRGDGLDPAVKGVTDMNPDLFFYMPREGRDQQCIERNYDTSKMPGVAVIIPYLHEDVALMKQLVGSLIANTPEHILQEILFVDDANFPNSESHADVLRALHPKVNVHRNEVRQGLIKAKVTGTENTKAPVIVFMEPHCIANRQWAEPLLEHLMQKPKSVAVPVIDALAENHTDRYSYYSMNPTGGFKWDLEFYWGGSARGRDPAWRSPEPYPMPALSGGILAMWRSWWEESGTYDAEMGEWGSENIEMSLRMWRCGGSIEAVPCSRIGHMFRHARPYSFHGEVSNRNKLRLAAVWLPEYLEHVYVSTFNLRKYMKDVGDLSDRTALRDRMKCKSMDWYMDNIYPELREHLPALPAKP